MGTKFEKNIMIGPSLTDASGKLSFSGCFDLFMDIATEHAEELGIGQSALAGKGQFWLTVKSRLQFYRRPAMTERVTLSTWPESSEHTRCIRNYRISKDGEVLAEGRTQWAVMDTARGTLVRIDELYPDSWNVQDDTFRLGGFEKINADFPDEPFAAYTVTSNDIDIGKHMNNVAYVRAFQSVFSTEEWKMLHARGMEIQYIKPCFEGEKLELRKAAAENIVYIKGSVGDRVSVLIRVI